MQIFEIYLDPHFIYPLCVFKLNTLNTGIDGLAKDVGQTIIPCTASQWFSFLFFYLFQNENCLWWALWSCCSLSCGSSTGTTLGRRSQKGRVFAVWLSNDRLTNVSCIILGMLDLILLLSFLFCPNLVILVVLHTVSFSKLCQEKLDDLCIGHDMGSSTSASGSSSHILQVWNYTSIVELYYISMVWNYTILV